MDIHGYPRTYYINLSNYIIIYYLINYKCGL